MTRKRSRMTSHGDSAVVELSQALYLNGRAMQEGPKRKTWSRHDLKYIKPLTPVQEQMFEAFFNGDNIFAHGSAGTGKSFVGIFLALSEILRVDSQVDRIIIVRSAVPTRDIGFLPGTLEEKNMVYEQPYRDIFSELIGKKSTYDDMKDAGKVEFVSTSFIRGVTWDNAVIIFDEVQNCTIEELHTVMTRVGQHSRVILCGDTKQNDLCAERGARQSGISFLLKAAARMSCMSVVQFTLDDCVRSGFVKEWLRCTEDLLP